MTIRPATFSLQRLLRALPKPLRRIKVAQAIATMTGSSYQRVAFAQGELVANVRDHEVANSLVRASFADYGYFDLARSLLAEGDVHVDVGANYGFHTYGLFQLPVGPTLNYVLVEANPDCVACLRASADLHPGYRVKIFHAAAAATAGSVGFNFNAAATGAGQVGSGSPSANTVTVPASTLDDLLAENQVDDVGLLKMDIEGSEVSALRGLAKMLSSHRIKQVYFEVNPVCLAQQGTDPLALFAEFTRHGYRLFWPHDGVDWVLKVYGPGQATAAELHIFTLRGREPRRVIAFDPTRYKAGQFSQCDLLAVSHRCQVEK